MAQTNFSSGPVFVVSTNLEQLNKQLAELPTVEEFKKNAESLRQRLKEAFMGWGAMHRMKWRHKKQLIDFMYEGKDKDNRKGGVYVRQISPRVYEYEIYSKFSQGLRFLKEFDDEYSGPETKPILDALREKSERERAARRAKDNDMGVINGQPLFTAIILDSKRALKTDLRVKDWRL